MAGLGHCKVGPALFLTGHSIIRIYKLLHSPIFTTGPVSFASSERVHIFFPRLHKSHGLD